MSLNVISNHNVVILFSRLEEDDDRMKAIQAGQNAIEKEYSNLESNISSEGGSLDIRKLANPNATSEPNESNLTGPKKVHCRYKVFSEVF